MGEEWHTFIFIQIYVLEPNPSRVLLPFSDALSRFQFLYASSCIDSVVQRCLGGGEHGHYED